MLKSLIYRLGSDPRKSWARFVKGLALFCIGVALIFAGAASWVWLQVPGVLLLGVGLVISAWGYAGVFANRFAQTFSRAERFSSQDK